MTRASLLVLAGWALAGHASGPPGAALPGVPAQADCARDVALRVQAHYEGVRDLGARFEQTTRSVTLGTQGSAPPLEAGGEVVFAKPGRMRWSYSTPEPSLVVSDGRTLWLYDPAAQEAQRMAVGGAFLSGAAIQFLMGEGAILDSFEVASPDCAAAQGEPLRLELQPREPATYERLVLTVDRATGAVRETQVEDLFGNVTRVRLLDVRTNQDPGAELFEFEPPEGVRVLDLSQRP